MAKTAKRAANKKSRKSAKPATRKAARKNATPGWRLAGSLLQMRAQLDAMYPGRSKENDGGIGDETHATGPSDHNPWVKDDATGVVTAIDVTHDPSSGCDGNKLAEALRKSRDERIKYVVWNRQICSATVSPWKWRAYTGDNPHTHHVHVSVSSSKDLYDDSKDWRIG